MRLIVPVRRKAVNSNLNPEQVLQQLQKDAFYSPDNGLITTRQHKDEAPLAVQITADGCKMRYLPVANYFWAPITYGNVKIQQTSSGSILKLRAGISLLYIMLPVIIHIACLYVAFHLKDFENPKLIKLGYTGLILINALWSSGIIYTVIRHTSTMETLLTSISMTEEEYMNSIPIDIE